MGDVYTVGSMIIEGELRMPSKRPSSPQLQAVPIRRELVSLAVVAANVGRELTPEAWARDVRIKVRMRATPAVLGDPAELFRALSCLVDSAAQHGDRVFAASGRTVALAHSHCAESDGRDFEPAFTQFPLVHGFLPRQS